MIYCSKCGHENNDDWDFCSECGSRLYKPNSDHPIAEAIPKKKSKLLPVFIAAVIAVTAVAAVIIIKGMKNSSNDSLDSAISEDISDNDLVYGKFMCQVNNYLYYTDENNIFCRIALDGTDQRVVFDGEVSNVISVEEYIYFNGITDGIKYTFRFHAPTKELTRMEGKTFDCFDVGSYYKFTGYDIKIYGICHNYSNNEEPFAIYECGADFSEMEKLDRIYLKNMPTGFTNIKVTANGYGFTITGINNRTYHGSLEQKKSTLADYSYNEINFEEQASHTIEVNGQKITDYIQTFDYSIFCMNGIKAMDNHGEIYNVTECPAEYFGVSGITVYFTRSEDGALCRAVIGREGYEEIKAADKKETPTVDILYLDAQHFNYICAPYISAADSEALRSVNERIFSLTNSRICSNKYDTDMAEAGKILFSASNDHEYLKIVMAVQDVSGTNLMTFNYNIQTGQLESNDKISGMFEKKKIADSINAILDTQVSEYDYYFGGPRVDPQDIAPVGFIEYEPGKYWIYFLFRLTEVSYQHSILLYDTADESTKYYSEYDIYSFFDELNNNEYFNAVEEFDYSEWNDIS